MPRSAGAAQWIRSSTLVQIHLFCVPAVSGQRQWGMKDGRLVSGAALRLRRPNHPNSGVATVCFGCMIRGSCPYQAPGTHAEMRRSAIVLVVLLALALALALSACGAGDKSRPSITTVPGETVQTDEVVDEGEGDEQEDDGDSEEKGKGKGRGKGHDKSKSDD